MAEDFSRTLTEAAADSGVVLAPSVVAGCATHYEALVRWNRTHNLTRIVDARDAATKHYLDCAVPLLTMPAPAAFIDVGAGAGFPGLVAALVWPAASVTLVEPARKRQSFLQVVSAAMGISATVTDPPLAGTTEGHLAAPVVLCRATFSEGGRHTLWPYVAPGGHLLAWTTPHEVSMWQQEASTWPGATVTTISYAVDGVERVLAVVGREA